MAVNMNIDGGRQATVGEFFGGVRLSGNNVSRLIEYAYSLSHSIDRARCQRHQATTVALNDLRLSH